MKKNIFKILAICVLIYFIIQLIYFFGFALMFSYGAGSGSEGAIESYDFKIDSISFSKEWKHIARENKEIEIKEDSISKGEYISHTSVLFINIKKTNHFKMCYYHTSNEKKEPITVTYLVRINNKTNDDFGWFSIEKYKGKKLFEETIVAPLSKKYERLE
jgi:hypothetical protein